ncbi:NAD(P)H-hydrate dehydratase [Raineyella fluvialis]|uniref:ADP-dependent (S)-NAD(P)H-hydrate dehydratase n=1 Tax=Raineyella fluvialis TaxID=2662261 RepID=A0A5Q2FC27_9ACTN|nr:NAD(P)H-hydrate dehydratase [Raineyella fluvialis]QGF24308.1 NAD(P)H-hydrate dehydratase [Raineyella fluvialis]
MSATHDTEQGGTVEAPQVVTSGLLRRWPLPFSDGDKDSQGRVLVVGGSVATPGAVRLAGEAAFRAGAGKVRILTAHQVAPTMAVTFPEAYVLGLPTNADGNLSVEGAQRIIEEAGRVDAVLFGPGMNDVDAAVALAGAVIPALQGTLCLDALGMAYVTENGDAVAHLAGRAVLSPNANELSFTLGLDGERPTDLAAATGQLAARTGAVVVSGAATSYVVTPEGRAWADDSGGPSMAVAGSGDVKSGIITGLLARGADPKQAAVWAAYVHGRCGERLASAYGRRGYLAHELLAVVPQVVTELEA